MAHRTMPILYINLCGEMLYIIDQRLIDTKTDPEKQIKGNNLKFKWFSIESKPSKTQRHIVKAIHC